MKRLSLLSVLMLIGMMAFGQDFKSGTKSLPRSTPSAEGVSSEWIMKYLDAIAQNDKSKQMHSIMIVKHGKVVAEGWWSPQSEDKPHRLWSTTKSFTATAVGFAIADGLLSVDDKVISFFGKDMLPDTISTYLAQMTVQDLLTMSAGQEKEEQVPGVDWVKTFLSQPVVHEPGTKFRYNSITSHTLSAIVQKVTGADIFTYLTPRLFIPLGIKDISWETGPANVTSGGWGLYLKTEDMAKFGQLFLNKGVWNGKQLLPKDWVDEATTLRIMQKELPEGEVSQSDWEQGYCYQMWRCRHNGYRADGAYGQFIIVMPDKDAVIVATANYQDMQAELQQIWDYLLPALDGSPASNTEADKELAKRLKSLKSK